VSQSSFPREAADQQMQANKCRATYRIDGVSHIQCDRSLVQTKCIESKISVSAVDFAR
jgi:hypothetical protein